MSLRTDDRLAGQGMVVSPRHHLVTAFLASWVTIGGFVDGYAHRNLSTPETFFTPWHGILYSGYLAVSVWLAWLVARNRSEAGSLRAAVPVGYGSSVAGVVVFFAGGLGDMLWHTVLGIETSIDALLSPTHLLLLVGALLLLSGPIRAVWGAGLGGPYRLVPVLAGTMAAAELGFFFQYMDGTSARFMETQYVPGPEIGYFAVVAGVGSILITTSILAGMMLLLLRGGLFPVGAGTILFGGFGLLMEVLEGFSFPEDLVAPVVAGLLADVMLALLRPAPGRPAALRAFAFLVPVALWSIRFAVFSAVSEIAWPVEVWSGLIVFTGLTGVGLSLLAFPPPAPTR